MKRKLVVLLLAASLTISATACTNMNGYAPAGATEETGETSSASQSVEPSATSNPDTGKNDPGKNDPVVIEESTREDILFPGYYSDVYYGLNQNGTKISEYNWKQVQKALNDRGLAISASPYAMGDGTYFYYDYELIGNEYRYNVYAVDADSLSVFPIMTVESGWWLDRIDYYQGKLYVGVASDDFKRKEYVYERTTTGVEFINVKNELDAAIESTQGYNLEVYSESLGLQYTRGSITRTMDETGFVVGYKDGYYKIAKDGTVSPIAGMPDNNVTIKGYDENAIIYYDYVTEGDAQRQAFYALNLYKEYPVEIVCPGAGESMSFLAYYNGKGYFSVGKPENFVLSDQTVYEYDVMMNSCNYMYEETSRPGATDLMPGTQGFQVVSGKLYYIGLDGAQEKWITWDPVTNTRGDDLGLVVAEKNVFKYGDVIFDSYEFDCPNCGIQMDLYYGEEFQLNSRYSAAADKINRTLADSLHGTIQSYQGSHDDENYTDEECQEHLEFPLIWCTSQEEELSNVRFLTDQYLAIDYSGYWYGGGAHGQPSMWQKLFNLETGEQLTIKDFYAGSEEDFKKLVATKTKADFLSYDEDMSPYYGGEDADSIYQRAYEYASLDASLITFEETGIYVIYPPYDMGPYASGFINIFISYEELLGRTQL